MDDFTFTYYEEIFEKALSNGYRVITLKDFFNHEYDDKEKVLVNRIDVDVKIGRLRNICHIFNKLDVKATIFLRLHASEYNLLSFGNINIVKQLISIGCEVGLHTELEDAGGICGLDKEDVLRHELQLFETVFGIKIHGTASHGDLTPYNNLDFWKERQASSFGLLYEAYDSDLWNNCRYVSDSEWIRWKAYENGVLLEGDRRTPIEHIDEAPRILHLLTHPESWYEDYIYE